MVDRTRKLGSGRGVRKHCSDWQTLSTLLVRPDHRAEDAGRLRSGVEAGGRAPAEDAVVQVSAMFYSTSSCEVCIVLHDLPYVLNTPLPPVFE